jgi:hypothetical protein
MFEMFKFLLNCATQATGGLIAGFVGLSLFLHKRKRDAKDAFLVSISQLRIRIGRIQQFIAGPGFDDFHVESRVILAEAVAKVYPFLRDRQKSKIDRLWREYDGIQPQELSREHEVGSIASFDKRFSEKVVLKPSERLLHYMNEFEDVAK